METAKCPHCESINTNLQKEWILQGKIIDKTTGKPYRFLIRLFKCARCAKTFRTSTRSEESA